MKPCPEQVQSSSYFHNPVPNICFRITHSPMARSLKQLVLCRYVFVNIVCARARARVCVREGTLPDACYLFLHLIFLYFIVLIIFTFHGSTALVCVGQLIAEVPISPLVIHTHPVRLLWKIDLPVPENSTWQHATLRRERHPCLWRNSKPQSQQASGRRPTS